LDTSENAATLPNPDRRTGKRARANVNNGLYLSAALAGRDRGFERVALLQIPATTKSDQRGNQVICCSRIADLK
jgi:hypothetical protein